MSVKTNPIPAPETKAWFSIQEAADHLGVNAFTIRRMIDRGELKARRFSKRVIRIKAYDLDRAGEPVESLAV